MNFQWTNNKDGFGHRESENNTLYYIYNLLMFVSYLLCFLPILVNVYTDIKKHHKKIFYIKWMSARS